MLAPSLDYDTSTDFGIELRSEGHNVFVARVTASPVGESRACPFKLPLEQSAIDEALANLSYTANNLLQRSAPRSSYDPLRSMGQALFTALIQENELGQFYRQAQALVERNNQGLRLQFITQNLQAAAIPWEFLFDPSRQGFVALSWRTPLIRKWGPKLHPIKSVELPFRLLIVSAEITPMGLGRSMTNPRPALRLNFTKSTMRPRKSKIVNFKRRDWHEQQSNDVRLDHRD
ncbi:MAG: hypothetical protein U0350_41555 [Caldilineaceae bacterium]